jgi:iron complex outermembrane recepter protein
LREETVRTIHCGTRRTLAAALLAGTSLTGAAPALAQDASGAEERDVIIVTAQKRTENLQDVPIAITAMGTETLDQLQVSQLQDAVKFLPSVTIQTVAPGFAQVYFRGVTSGENANHSASLPTVGTYLDEMPITTIQGALDIHAYDLARVEALAGPQGTLYGASSMAGTIKLVTNAPEPGETYGAVDLELNKIADGDFGYTGEGFVNLPLGERAAMRLVGWYRHDGGYIDNIPGSRTYPTSGITDDNSDLVEDDYNDVDTYGARLALGIDLDDNWTLRPTLMGQVQESNGSFAQERSTAVNDDLQTVQYNPESGKDKWIQAALTIEGRIGNWDLVATGGHLRRKTRTESDYSDYAYFYDALFGYGAYFYDNDGDFINPHQYIQGIDTYRRSFGELRVSSPQDAPLRFIGGVFAQRQSHLIEQNYIIDDLTDLFTVTGTESNIWLTKQRRVDRDYAAFGEVTFDITDQLAVTGGVRVYHYKNSLVGFFGYNANFSSRTGEAACFAPAVVPGSPCTNLGVLNADGSISPKRSKGDGATWRANLTYKFTPDNLIWFTASTGFRPGGINRAGTAEPFGADKLYNYEIGSRNTFMDRQLTFNIVGFIQDWKNVQVTYQPAGGSGVALIGNVGAAQTKGIEVDLGWRSPTGFSLTASGTYVDARLKTPFILFGAVTAPAGQKLPLTPRFKGNVIGRYEWGMGGGTAHMQLAGVYVGERNPVITAADVPKIGVLPDYFMLDASLGYAWNGMKLELYVRNLTDERAQFMRAARCNINYCGPTSRDPVGEVYRLYAQPRTIGLRFGQKF